MELSTRATRARPWKEVAGWLERDRQVQVHDRPDPNCVEDTERCRVLRRDPQRSYRPSSPLRFLRQCLKQEVADPTPPLRPRRYSRVDLTRALTGN